MNANANSGILDTCKCRISIRMVSVSIHIFEASNVIAFKFFLPSIDVEYIICRKKKEDEISVNLALWMLI